MMSTRRPRGRLVLADGAVFEGRLVGGASLPAAAEVVFNTSMTGYQEILTDPSYAGQIIVMTYPQIGNYGAHVDDDEKSFSAAAGLVVRELSAYFSPAPGRMSLEAFMIERDVPGLSDVDTRALALHIRTRGAIAGAIGSASHSVEELLAAAKSRESLGGGDLVAGVAGRKTGRHDGITGRVAVVDFGVKESIVSAVRKLGVEVVVLPARGSRRGGFDERAILDGGFDFVVLSNGPGDPADVPGAIESVECLLGNVPVFGICLGHQIAARAMGGRTFKLKFGHRGANQPVKCHRTGRVLITSQNHSYAVDGGVPGAVITYSNLNDGTVEGFSAENPFVECVQFHPEASPGPHDAFHIFENFFEKVRSRNAALRPHAVAAAAERTSDAQTV